jgi:uncharacterized protein YcaQ
MERLTAAEARRLALARAGLLDRRWTGLSPSPRRAAAHAVIGRFGYLQLDTVSVAGARSHALVLMARLPGLDPSLAESLLVPGAPLFEYWGHAASWLPLDLYPVMGFRRRAFETHPWWGDVVARNPGVAEDLLRRAPFRSADLEGERTGGWWGHKDVKRVAEGLWSCGRLAIRERRNFQRVYDLAERVIPEEVRNRVVPEDEAYRRLLLLALDGHGWAEAGTLATTFHLRKTRPPFRAALEVLAEAGEILPCEAEGVDGTVRRGWIRPRDLELASRLRRLRPAEDRGVLLTPFDPLLWDRSRVRFLFGFEQVLEIYVPAARRRFGYFCLPVLAGERLVARVDLKAERGEGRVRVLALHYEEKRPPAADRGAVASALARHGDALGFKHSQPLRHKLAI